MKNLTRIVIHAAAALALVAFAAPTSADLVGHWALDEPNGTTGAGSIADSTGNHNATPNGTTGLGAAGANANTGTSADLSGGSFDVAYDAALNPASFTFTAWVNPDSAGGFQAVMTNRDDVAGAAHGFILYNNSSGNWSYWQGTGVGSGQWQPLDGPAVSLNTWQHVAISYDAATQTRRLWVNGSVAASDVGAAYAINGPQTEDLHIGGGGDDGASFRFDGEIDDAALFNHSLSALQMENVAKYGVASGAGDWVNASLGKDYAYTVLPGFSGGTHYFDDDHVQLTNTFDTGDLTNGLFKDNGSPTTSPTPPNELVGWDNPVTKASTITIDLDGIFHVDLIEIGTHTWTAFANGAPDSVRIDFSLNGIDWFGAETFNFTAADVPTDGHHDLVADVARQTASFVRFEFDGGAVNHSGVPNKWMLDELTVFAQAPTPAALPAGLGMMMLVLGRRRRH